MRKYLTNEQSDALFRQRNGDSMTTKQLMDAVIETVPAMDSDQKAHLRAKMDKSLGFRPKASGGKPS
jgi:hypothetical protein